MFNGQTQTPLGPGPPLAAAAAAGKTIDKEIALIDVGGMGLSFLRVVQVFKAINKVAARFFPARAGCPALPSALPFGRGAGRACRAAAPPLQAAADWPVRPGRRPPAPCPAGAHSDNVHPERAPHLHQRVGRGAHSSRHAPRCSLLLCKSIRLRYVVCSCRRSAERGRRQRPRCDERGRRRARAAWAEHADRGPTLRGRPPARHSCHR